MPAIASPWPPSRVCLIWFMATMPSAMPTIEPMPHNTPMHEATIDAIREETGVDEYDLLWSIKEYKKVRLRYYGPEWDEWRAEHLTPAG